MADIRKGCFCKSTAGHDKDSYYIIVETEKGIAVADGKVRKLANPKYKNPKHLEVMNYTDAGLDKKFAENKIKDEDIKYSIKKFLTHTNK